jgi:outer membrane receptor for ferrienterochelin and colicin
MEKTVSYEFGFQQQIEEDIALQATVFSRDIRNLVATDLIVETYKQGTKYSQYINRSFGQVHGITLSLEKRYSNNFSAFLDYTYQIAQGDASDPQNAYNASKGSHPREPAKQLVPLDWDRHHTINVSASYSPQGPSNWGMTLVGKYGSGLPYTPQDRSINTGFENDGRKPDFYTVDLSAFKAFQLSPKTQRRILLTLNVQNLLDTKNENSVYTDTGRAGYTLAEQTAHATDWNTLDEYYNDPGYYSTPRSVKIGVKVEY